MIAVTYSNYIYQLSGITNYNNALIYYNVGGNRDDDYISSDGNKRQYYMHNLNSEQLSENCTKMTINIFCKITARSETKASIEIYYKKNNSSVWYYAKRQKVRVNAGEYQYVSVSCEVDDVKDINAIRINYTSHSTINSKPSYYDVDNINTSFKFE